jgi:disulfide bond formation protein DsbB
MFPYIAELNMLVAFGTICMQGGIAFLLLHHFVFRWPIVEDLIRQWSLHLAFALSLFGMLSSIFYSEIIGYLPCDLCWWGRVLLYPQVFIYGVGLYLNDRRSALYGIVLSIVGVIVSLYHYYIEMGGAAIYECASEAAGGVSCAAVYIKEFGYVTFSMMSLTIFVFLIVLLVQYLRTTR